MTYSFWPGILSSLLIYLVFAAIVLFALHWVIRSAVQSALRRHQLWLEARDRDIRRGPTGAIGNNPTN
ncbi:hypothetical protein SAMN06295879_2117 [Agreia bicolorata]|uniref:Uncharacterized protein n=1 Tax=Agreia bicolorata TaxID=110935 RepID=A0A1T4Y2E4_9MICO|nr:hypothetical protein [Agreia bicolorata]KJC64637.1 hypothetical protein TZ00_09890 [Agreia bicolorata]SKA95910.1 hypothetical protein SAMN06295879_2117 [Agreia bicolorata]